MTSTMRVIFSKFNTW